MTVRTGTLTDLVNGLPMSTEVLGENWNEGPGVQRWRGYGTSIRLSTGSVISTNGPLSKEPPHLDGQALFRVGDDDRPVPFSTAN